MKEMQKEAYKTAVKRNQWEKGIDAAKLSLYEEVSEFSKADELSNTRLDDYVELKKKIGLQAAYEFQIAGTQPDELADVVICAMSTAEYLGIDLLSAVKLKMEYNKVR